MMEDRRIQIPSGCLMNVMIIDRLSQTELFKKYCVEVPRSVGVKPLQDSPDFAWPFMNFSWGAYMLYCLLVVPKELYDLPKEDSFYENIKKKNAMKYFTIRKEKHTFDENPRYHFASLRNAVSHVHFSMDQNEVIAFWDHEPKNPKNRHWEAIIKQDNLIKFLINIGSEVTRIYEEIKSGNRNYPKGHK